MKVLRAQASTVATSEIVGGTTAHGFYTLGLVKRVFSGISYAGDGSSSCKISCRFNRSISK